MVNSQLKSVISSYGAEQLHPVSPGEYAYIAGRGIRFHNYVQKTSRMFWPSMWETNERPGFAFPNRDQAQSDNSVKSTRDLFRNMRSASTPNTSITSHDRGSDIRSMDRIVVDDEGSIASSATNQQSGSLTHRGGNSTARKAHQSFNPFQKLGKKLNSASINVMATCSTARIFAFGEKRLNPAIHIHDSQSFQHIKTLTNATTIEFTYLNFSRDGKYLVGLGSIPDFSVTVWNVETGEVMASATTSSQTTSITFDPRDPTQLCSTGANGHLIFWIITAGSLRSNEPKLATSDLVDASQFLCHTWGRNSDIFVGAENGDILYFPSIHDIGDLMSPDQLEGTEAIRSLTISKFHLISGSDDGIIRLYSLDTKEFCRQFHIATGQNQLQDLSFDEQDDEELSSQPWIMRQKSTTTSDICSIILNPPFDTLVVGCSNGSLYEVTIQGYFDRNSVISDMKLNSLNITTRLVNDSHCGAVNDLCIVQCDGTNKLVTTGEDGSIRIWNYRRGVLEHKLLFNASFTTMKNLKNLVFVGSSQGYLRIIELAENVSPRVLFSVRLRASSIEQIDVDTHGNCVIRFSDNYVAVLMLVNTNESTKEYSLSSLVHESFQYRLYLAGFLKAEFGITCIRISNDQTVYVATDDCSLLLFKIPKHNLFASAPDYLLSSEHLSQRKWKLDYPALNMIQLPNSNGELLVFSLDKSIKHYDISNASSLSPVSPIQEVESHVKSNTAIVTISADGKYFASGADDGLLWIRTMKSGFDMDKDLNREGCSILYSCNPAEGGVKSICFGSENDNHLVFICGGDGTVLVADISLPSTNDSEFLGTTLAEIDQETPALYLASEEYGVDNEKQPLITDPTKDTTSTRFISTAAREKCEKTLALLQNEFNEIREENENAPANERIPESEFIFDTEYVSTIDKFHDEEVEKFKEKLRNENLKKELLTQRIIEECVKSIEHHNETITGLIDTQLHVMNYVIPHVDPQKLKLLEKIKFMRRVEETDLINRRKYSLVRDLEGGLHNEEQNYNQDSTRQGYSAEEDELSEEIHNFHKYVMPEYDIKSRARVPIPSNDSVLYSRFDLYTRQRKISQMWLLHGEIYNIKIKFNENFKELQLSRENVINKVERVNSLIVDIVNDLEYEPEGYTFKFSNVENNLLEVRDSEVQAEKWVDPKELARRQEEERRKRAALENSKELEIIERALQMMMDGRLEDKSKKKTTVDDIPKPSCYNKSSDELTDSEKKAMLEYEKVVKEFEEEETKKRKQLEAKLKNAQNEIIEACNAFDQKLKELFKNKLQCNHTIFETELAIIKLSQSVLDHEDNLTKQDEQKRIESQLEQQNTEFVQTVQQFEKVIQEYSRSCEDLNHSITELERSFKDNIIQFIKQYQQQHSVDYATKDSQEVVADRLAKVYPRSKSLKLKIPTRQEFIQRTQSNPDPFIDIATEKDWAPPALTQAVKRPENVSDWLWKKFLGMRKEKILLEYDYLLRMQDLEKKQIEGQRLREHTKYLEEIISRQIKERNKFNDRVLREQYNLDYLFNFKQGQIEVEQQAVVTDYGDAILISKQNIIDLNRQIINNATQNIEQMRAIMDQSKRIEQITWENDALQFETEEKDDIYLRFQRLRVTKDMQAFLKTGQSSQERDRERLVDQIQHTKQIRDVRVKEKKKAAIKIRKNMERTSKENDTLRNQLNQMQHLVTERKEIHELQSSTTAKEKSDQKMKQLRMERKLQDLSKTQAKEIEQLKQTIQVLRERTFPSFALVQKRPGV